MAEDAVALHELFLALQAGGFTRDEALLLVGYVIAGGREALWTVEHLTDRHLPP